MGPVNTGFEDTGEAIMTFNASWDAHHAEDARLLVRGHPVGIKFDQGTHPMSQPDTLLPSEYFDTYRRKTPIQAEKRLMLAVLQDGVQCFQKYAFSQSAKGRSFFQEALEWIVEEDSDWPFSFEAICETLAINPGYLRHNLLRWREKQPGNVEKPMLFPIGRRRVQHGRRRTVSKPSNDGGSKGKVVR